MKNKKAEKVIKRLQEINKTFAIKVGGDSENKDLEIIRLSVLGFPEIWRIYLDWKKSKELKGGKK